MNDTMIRWCLCLCIFLPAAIAAAESKKKLTPKARANFKALAPDKIKVEKGEEQYLGAYGLAYQKLETAIIKLDTGEHRRAKYAIDGFLHYMNQLKWHAFKDELAGLCKMEEKVWGDLLNASMTEACSIPLKQVLIDKVIDEVPDKAANFKKWARGCRDSVKISAYIDPWDNPRGEPRLNLFDGATETKTVDGQFQKAEVMRVVTQRWFKDKALEQVWSNGGVVQRCRAMLLISQSTKGGEGMLKVPFSFIIWRKANGKQEYKDVKVDFANSFAITKQ